MKEIRARLITETVMLSKLAMIVDDARMAAYDAGDDPLRESLEGIDWRLREAIRMVMQATEYTTEGESK